MIQLSAEFYQRREALEAEMAAVNDWLAATPKIETDADEARAADALDGLRKRLASLEAARKDDKAPHMEAARAVDAAYAPISAALTVCVNLLKARVQERLRAKHQALERERAEAARAAAEAARAAQEAAKAAEAAADVHAHLAAAEAADEAKEAADRARAAAAVRPQASGHYTTRAVTLRKTRVAVLTDWRAAIKWARAEDQRHLALKAWLEQHATAALRHGAVAVPGFTIEEKESVS